MQAKSPSMLVAVLVTSAIALLDAWTGDRAVLLGLLIAGPLLAARVPQPGGSLVYELLTGHPERQAGELVFVADLTVELRAWPHDTWAKLGVDPDQIAQPVIGCWQARRGHRAAARRP